MSENEHFAELVGRVRGGDSQAAAELLRQYEPHIRRMIRVRLTDPSLRRQMDSVDICQSVMGDFFVRAALGQFEVDTPEQLIKLLATMARNRLIKHVHKQQAAKRDIRRLGPITADELQVAGSAQPPSQIVAGEELLRVFRDRLTTEDRYLADQRAQGRAWSELAQELGGNADALRIRFTRVVNRVAAELGLEDTGDG